MNNFIGNKFEIQFLKINCCCILLAISGFYFNTFLLKNAIDFNVLQSFVFLFLAILIVFVKNNKILIALVVLSFIYLFIRAFSVALFAPFQIIEFFENTIKISVFVNLFYYLKYNKLPIFFTKICIASTFIAHGFLALNIIKTPDTFFFMVHKILFLNPENSVVFLKIIGILDIVCSVLLFVKTTQKITLFYLITWGFLTAMARVLSHFDTNLFLYFFETIYRLPNAIIPFLLYKYIHKLES